MTERGTIDDALLTEARNQSKELATIRRTLEILTVVVVLLVLLAFVAAGR